MVLHYALPEWEGIYDSYGLEREELFYFLAHLEEGNNMLPIFRSYRDLPNCPTVLFQFRRIPPELPEVIHFLQMFYRQRIILFAEESPETTDLFAQLAHGGVRDCKAFPRETTPAEYVATLNEVLSADGVSFTETLHHQIASVVQQIKRQAVRQIAVPEGCVLRISFSGAQPRTGVTTQCFMAYHALTKLGFTPCILDSRQDFILTLLQLYEPEERSSVVRIHGIHLAAGEQPGSAYNAYLTDLGCGTAGSRDFNVALLCAGGKPWELPLLAKALTKKAEEGIRPRVLLSFVEEEEQPSLREYIGELADCFFPPYSPSLWKMGGEKTYLDFYYQLASTWLAATKGGSVCES